MNKGKNVSEILQNDPKDLIDVDYTLVKDHKFWRDNWKIYSFFLKVIWMEIKRNIACKLNWCMIKRFWNKIITVQLPISRIILRGNPQLGHIQP